MTDTLDDRRLTPSRAADPHSALWDNAVAPTPPPDRDRTNPPPEPSVDAIPSVENPTRRLHAAWRERAQSRIVDLDLELDCLPSRLNRALSALEQRRVHTAKKRLLEASVVVKRRPSPWSAWNGVDVEKAWV
ncbi:MAG: hypothetical protein QOE41_1338, partial [Mycobacterium sp.]|nr:hypothetical protein [Mycobacterium sp.]